MATLRIQPHGRLHEWVAHDRGYFVDEGLDYEFRFVPPADRDASGEVLSGAYELYAEGKGAKGSDACDVSSACHWAVNQAASNNIGRMWGGAYSVTPSGIYVADDSPVMRPEDLAGVEIAAGYHSGSHFTAIQALEAFLEPDAIRLQFIGRPMERVDAAIDGRAEAVSAWGMGGYILEQTGFRRVLDTTFMVGIPFPPQVFETDIRKFMNAMRRAQMDIDLAPERYKHFYLEELPERFGNSVDVRRFGAGERIVFLPYSETMYRETQQWISERGLFEPSTMALDYDEAVRR